MGNYGDGEYGSGTYGDPLGASPGASSVWNNARWSVGTWISRTWPPGASWKTSWRWWYQLGTSAQVGWELTGKVMEARWTTDGHTLGDGSWRGDLQPGRLVLKVYDPAQTLLGLSKLGTIWATFIPTGATWCWFVDSVTVQLAPSGSQVLNEQVITADAWPARLTASSYQSARPLERVDARVAAIVNRLNTDTGLVLPAVSGSIETDAHMVPAVVSVTGENVAVFPGFLQQLRDAASNGLLWLEAFPGADVGYAGALVVHYMLVETVQAASLYNDQVVMASAWSQGLDQLITEVAWTGTRSDGVTVDTLAQYSGGWGAYGIQKKGPLRVWGDISASGAQYGAINATGNETLRVRADPTVTYVDSISMISGDRQTIAWNPTKMVWPPHGVIQWYRVSGQPQESYRVVKSDHVLNARSWTVAHTLEPFVQPSHIP